MKSLFNENFNYAEEANDLMTLSFRASEPLFDKYMSEGYSPREISHIIQAACQCLESEKVIKFNMDRKRLEKKMIEVRELKDGKSK